MFRHTKYTKSFFVPGVTTHIVRCATRGWRTERRSLIQPESLNDLPVRRLERFMRAELSACLMPLLLWWNIGYWTELKILFHYRSWRLSSEWFRDQYVLFPLITKSWTWEIVPMKELKEWGAKITIWRYTVQVSKCFREQRWKSPERACISGTRMTLVTKYVEWTRRQKDYWLSVRTNGWVIALSVRGRDQRSLEKDVIVL